MLRWLERSWIGQEEEKEGKEGAVSVPFRCLVGKENKEKKEKGEKKEKEGLPHATIEKCRARKGKKGEEAWSELRRGHIMASRILVILLRKDKEKKKKKEKKQKEIDKRSQKGVEILRFQAKVAKVPLNFQETDTETQLKRPKTEADAEAFL